MDCAPQGYGDFIKGSMQEGVLKGRVRLEKGLWPERVERRNYGEEGESDVAI